MNRTGSIHTASIHTVAIAAICVLGLAIYWNTLNVPFAFDDDPNIRNISEIRVTELDMGRFFRAGFQPRANNRPVANLSFALNYYWGRYDVRGYHAVNIAIHLVNGILVYLLARITFCQLYRLQYHTTPPPDDRSIAWQSLFAACIFIAHPLQTQSVTYIVQRMTSMAVMFYLLAVLLYIWGLRSESPWKRWSLWAGCFLSWFMALGSKQIAVTFPLMILLYQWYFFEDLNLQWLKRHAKLFIGLAVVVGLLCLIYLHGSPLERLMRGYDRRDFTMGERVLTQFRVVMFYISLLLFPHPARLNLLHYFCTSKSLLEPITTLFSLAGAVALVAAAICLCRQSRLASFCVLWFFGNLVIESSVLPLEMVFEHRVYLPMFGFAMLASHLLFSLFSSRLGLAIGISGLATVLLATASVQRNRVWGDEEGLWADVLAKNPKSARAHCYKGILREQHGDPSQARWHYEQALTVKPNYALAHFNLGNTLANEGQPAEAIQRYLRAVQLDPNYADAHNNLGNLLKARGEPARAKTHYLKVLDIDPNHDLAYNNLGDLLEKEGNLTEARSCYQHAVRVDPESAAAHTNLGHLLARLGEFALARQRFTRAIQLDAGYADAHAGLGHLATFEGDEAQAKAFYERALSFNPDDPQVRNNLAWLLATCDDPRLRDASEALRLATEVAVLSDDKDPKILDTLAAAYAAAGQFDRAIATANRAVRLCHQRGRQQLAAEIQHRLQVYHNGHPYRTK